MQAPLRHPRQRTSPNGSLNFGFSSILLTFVILCIAGLGALSLATAISDYKLSRKVTDNATAYYHAENEVNLELAAVDTILSDCYETSHSQREFAAQLSDALAGTDGTLTQEHGTFRYLIHKNIADSRYLDVLIGFTYPRAGQTNYSVISQKNVTQMSEPVDNTLHVIQ